jgi:D-alanine-D-alanine ligase-like ATP-grasp enzyme
MSVVVVKRRVEKQYLRLIVVNDDLDSAVIWVDQRVWNDYSAETHRLARGCV